MSNGGEPIAFSTEDAARSAGLSVQTIRRAITRKELRAKKCGARLLILRADLVAFLERQPDAILATA
jgi:excisionase family DNA binding protein